MVFIMYEDSTVAESALLLAVLLCSGRKIITHTLKDTYTMKLFAKKKNAYCNSKCRPGEVIMVNRV